MEHRDGQTSRELAPVKKTIYSLIDLREILLGCNRRYLEFLSALDDFSAGHRSLDKLTAPKAVDGHRVKGFNFFDKTEHSLLCALQRPQFNISGVRRADLKLIKRAANSYRYYLTRLGRNAIAAACRISEQIIVPALAALQNLLRICKE